MEAAQPSGNYITCKEQTMENKLLTYFFCCIESGRSLAGVAEKKRRSCWTRQATTDRTQLSAAPEIISLRTRSRNTNPLIMGIFTAGDTMQIMLEVPS